MPRQLKDINVAYISLVKEGANEKDIVLKSGQIKVKKEVKILKSIEGVVYGLVYSPDQEDTQGDFAKAEDIKKAAYEFMKQQNTTNVDQNHNFEKAAAFVCESWILKENDSIFADQPVGSWAVGIKLEDDVLIKAVQNGEIGGLSMAGSASTAQTTETTATKKEDTGVQKSVDGMIEAMKKAFERVNIDVSAGWYKKSKQETGGNTLDLGQMKEITKSVEDGMSAIAKAREEDREVIAKLKVEVDELSKEIKKSKQVTSEVPGAFEGIM